MGAAAPTPIDFVYASLDRLRYAASSGLSTVAVERRKQNNQASENAEAYPVVNALYSGGCS